MFVPVPTNPLNLGKARQGEHIRSWSAGAGSGALATGLVQVAWILRELHHRSGATQLHLDWSTFRESGGVYVWEAFVTDRAKAATHVDDAAVAVEAFMTALPDPEQHNAVVADEPLSLVGAAAAWSGWLPKIDALARPCLVVKAVPAGDSKPTDAAPEPQSS